MPSGQSVTEDQIKAACDLIADGKSHRAAAEVIGVNRQTLLNALMTDDYNLAYTRARVIRAYVKQDDMDSLLEQTVSGDLAPDVARVVLGNWQWQMARMDGKRWGDKNTTAITDADGKNLPVQNILLTFVAPEPKNDKS